MNDVAIQDAFESVATTYSKVRHGKYIPLTYWVIKVNKKLHDRRITPRKLLRSLENLNLVNRTLDVAELGGVVKVVATERRITRGNQEGSKPTRVGFLCVITSDTPEEILPLNQTELGRFFQSRYFQYQTRKSILIPLPPLFTMAAAAV